MAIGSHHYDFMTEAIREAEIKTAEGGLPITAVLTRDDQIIARGHNMRLQERNVILHGEMSWLRNAGLICFYDTAMYATLSPCRMCARRDLAVQAVAACDRGVRDLSGKQGHPHPIWHSLHRSRRRAVDQHDEALAVKFRQPAPLARRHWQLM